jgi:hypothetical protein
MSHNEVDHDFIEAIEGVSNEIDSRRTFMERVRDKGMALRLFIELVLRRVSGAK